MRSILLLLMTVLLALPAAASEQLVDPSHPRDHTHQPLTSTCSECHRCEEPTPADPCLIDCPRHGGRFYGTEDPGEGPDVVIIDQLANIYEPVVFAHKLHAGMATMGTGCTSCHHYSEQSGEIPPCRQCHDADRNEVSLHMPALKGAYHRQCINCHLDWSGDNSCAFCHAEAGNGKEPAPHDPTDIVGVPHPLIEATETYTYETDHEDGPIVTFHHADHVEMFGQPCVACHQGDSCKRCHHGSSATRSRRVDHVTSCCSCHVERDCAFCHREESIPRFDHAISTGFDLAPYHSDHECQTCHSTPADFRHPTARCADCHIHWEVGSFDHAVTGLTLSEDHVDLDCESCHLDMDFRSQPSCEDCHDEPMLPTQWPGTRVSVKK